MVVLLHLKYLSEESKNNMNGRGGYVSVSMTPQYGTATKVDIPTILPDDKSKKELFWVEALVKKVTVAGFVSVQSNDDDSNGNHDVVIVTDRDPIGVQVTRLTSELQKKRDDMKERYLENVIEYLRDNNISSDRKVAITLHFTGTQLEKSIKPKKIAAIARSIEKGIAGSDKRIDCGDYQILFQYFDGKEFYIQNINNIGVDVTFDQIPRSLKTYQETVDVLASKKSKSKSPWLLIWSLDFYKDKHTFGDDTIEHMKQEFRGSHFKKVYFLESVDGNGFFEANLTLHIIKDEG